MFAFPLMTSILGLMPKHGARTALVDGAGTHVSYADLHDAVRRRAGAFQARGVGKGDRIVLLEDNSIDYVVGLWAGFLVGAVVVPVSPELPRERLAYIVKDSGAVLAQSHLGDRSADIADLIDVVGDADADTPLADIEAVRGALVSSDRALIIYTSGSTGAPKGVTLTHLNVFSACQSVSHYLGITEQERIFCAVPFTFDYGMHQITMSALHGATLHIEASFRRPNLSLKRMEREKITCLPIVPAMVRMMLPLKDRYDLSAIRKVTNTAAALGPAIQEKLRTILPEADIFSMYGLTECHRCTYLPPAELSAHPTSVGYAIPDTQMWVVDNDGIARTCNATGELMIRGNTVMEGYWNKPDKTAERLIVDPVTGQKHLRTGDLCALDGAGRLTFLSRADAVVKVRGEKWVPTTAENALARFPTCAEVSCVAVEDTLGELRTMAFLVPGQEARVDPREVIQWCAAHLEPVYVPERVSVMASLPRTPNGKTDLQALRRMAQDVFA